MLLAVAGMSADAAQVMTWADAYAMADGKIAGLTLDEKLGFMRGYSEFYLYGVPDKGIPYLYLSDATAGVNIRRNLPDTTLVRQLDRSTAMPCPHLLAATFDPAMAREYARAVGEECRAGGIEVLLGPGLNIARNSQCGRNYEYFGEDPCLSAAMCAAYVEGMQSTGTAACLKHFLCNETEFYRRRSNSVVDSRALHEIYLPPFKAGIDAGAAYVMASYNRLNGEWTGQNRRLLTDMLRDTLGFRGAVMSDWSSVYDTEKVVKSGLNIEMPGRREMIPQVRELLARGTITEEDIDRMIRPVLATGYAFGLYDRPKYEPALLDSFPAHERIAYKVASEGIVLLKNDGILPLAKGRRILAVGRYLDEVPRTGVHPYTSATVDGYNNVTFADALRAEYGDDVVFADDPTVGELARADVVIVSLGTEDNESFERPFALPSAQERLVRLAVENNPRCVVVVNSGSGVRMSAWNDRAAAIVYGWYPGQNGMAALTDILSGKINPSGKLPITIERDFRDSPACNTMPPGAQFYNTTDRAYNERLIMLYDVNYDESVLVGYRWYDTKGIAPLYPFGHGLSYTTFELERPQVKVKDGNIHVEVDLCNSGIRSGAEVVQIYTSEDQPTVLRPVKELKSFARKELAPGEKARLKFDIPVSELGFWDDTSSRRALNPGLYTIHIATSSADIPISRRIVLDSSPD